jgi:hypothetical protein
VIDGDEEPRSSTSPLQGQEYERRNECSHDGDGADTHGVLIRLFLRKRKTGRAAALVTEWSLQAYRRQAKGAQLN